MSSTTIDTATYDAIGQAIEAWRTGDACWQAPTKTAKGHYRLKSTGRVAPWSRAVRDLLPPERLDRVARQDEGKERRRYTLSVKPRDTLSHLLFAVSQAIGATQMAASQDFANTYTAPDVYADIMNPLHALHSRIAEIASDEDLVVSLSTLPALQSDTEATS